MEMENKKSNMCIKVHLTQRIVLNWANKAFGKLTYCKLDPNVLNKNCDIFMKDRDRSESYQITCC